jgi:hypothetical protein
LTVYASHKDMQSREAPVRADSVPREGQRFSTKQIGNRLCQPLIDGYEIVLHFYHIRRLFTTSVVKLVAEAGMSTESFSCLQGF